MRTGEFVPEERGETVLEYGTRWVAWRKGRGLSSAKENETQLRVHFNEKHGPLPMAGITHEALEDFVSDLDKRVLAQEMNWKTAVNVWSTVAVMFRDAHGAKDRAMRVEGMRDSPARGVAPPDKGEETAKQFLYPSEFWKLVACADVPLLYARLYTVSLYTQTRQAEVLALDWSDIDSVHWRIHVTVTADFVRDDGKKHKRTKARKARRFDIERELRPLLVAMHRESGGKGRLFPTPPVVTGEMAWRTWCAGLWRSLRHRARRAARVAWATPPGPSPSTTSGRAASRGA